MLPVRRLRSSVAALLAVLGLGGCVAYPDSYEPGYGYGGGGYYTAPTYSPVYSGYSSGYRGSYGYQPRAYRGYSGWGQSSGHWSGQGGNNGSGYGGGQGGGQWGGHGGGRPPPPAMVAQPQPHSQPQPPPQPRAQRSWGGNEGGSRHVDGGGHRGGGQRGVVDPGRE